MKSAGVSPNNAPVLIDRARTLLETRDDSSLTVTSHAPAPFGVARPQPAPRCRCRALSLLLVAPFLGACALNDHGFVRVRRFENDSAVLLRLTAIGAHLVMYSGDAGLTLGYSDRTYVFPRLDRSVRVPMSRLVDPGSWDRLGRLHPTESEGATLGAPIMRVARTGGISFDANRNRVGVALGFAYRSALWLPTDGSRVVLIRYASGDDAVAQVIIDQEGAE